MLESIRYRLQPAGPTPPPPGPGAPERPFTDQALATPILVVEDETLIAWMMADLLADLGFTDVRLARDYNEALRKTGERRPGLLICDVNLGGDQDGIGAAAAILAGGALPVAFVTGYAGHQMRDRIEQAIGPVPVLRKPIQAAPLAATLRALLDAPARH